MKILRQFHDWMEVKVNVGGTLSDVTWVVNGVKPNDMLAPVLFALYFGI